MSHAGITRHVPRSELAATLLPRHVTMVAFGGTIGAGIFVGSGQVIAATGPAVVVCYLVVGMLAAVIMRLLSVLARLKPDSAAFATYAGDAFGHIGRFGIGWMYWWLMVITSSVECGTAASIAHAWWPGMPQWTWALVITAMLTAINLGPVRLLGEVQFWLVLVKMTFAVVVPTVTVLAVIGVLPGIHSPGMTNITLPGGIVPNGPTSVFAGILVAVFSFTGIEIAAVAASESDQPRRTARKSLPFVGNTVLVCYVVAMTATVLLVPWNDPQVAASPFGAMMTALHLPDTVAVLRMMVLIAVISVHVSNLYAASRIGYALATSKDAPPSWRRLSAGGTPRAAVVGAALVSLAVTLIGYVLPGNVFRALTDSSGAVGIGVWIAIAVAYLKLRPRTDPRLNVAAIARQRRLGYAAWIVTLVMVIMLISMIFLPATQLQILMTMLPVTIIFIVVLWRETNASADPESS